MLPIFMLLTESISGISPVRPSRRTRPISRHAARPVCGHRDPLPDSSDESMSGRSRDASSWSASAILRAASNSSSRLTPTGASSSLSSCGSARGAVHRFEIPRREAATEGPLPCFCALTEAKVVDGSSSRRAIGAACRSTICSLQAQGRQHHGILDVSGSVKPDRSTSRRCNRAGSSFRTAFDGLVPQSPETNLRRHRQHDLRRVDGAGHRGNRVRHPVGRPGTDLLRPGARWAARQALPSSQFRSMSVNAETDGVPRWAANNDQRIIDWRLDPQDPDRRDTTNSQRPARRHELHRTAPRAAVSSSRR